MKQTVSIVELSSMNYCMYLVSKRILFAYQVLTEFVLLIIYTGFDHEHNRPDRDNYVIIDYNNIDPQWVRRNSGSNSISDRVF